MKPFLQIIKLIIFLLPFCANAQQSLQEKSIPKKKIGRWEIAYGVGESYIGSKRDIYDKMIQSGLDDYSTNQWWFFDFADTDYPIISKNPAVHYSIKYNFSQRHGIKAVFGVNDEHSVSGYRSNTLDYLTLHSKVQAASLSYVRNLKNGRHSFAAGPSLILYSIDQTNDGPRHNSVKPGINLGYSFKLLNGKNFFLQIEPNYTWGPITETGSFSNGNSQQSDGEDYEVLFQSTKAQLSTLTFELSFGFKLGRVE